MGSRSRPADGDKADVEGTTERFSLPQRRGLRLRVINGDQVTRVPLPNSGEVVIGRGEKAHLRIEDSSISRRHAVLHVGKTVEIEDLESANGTRIGGRVLTRGERVPLALLDVVDLGNVLLILESGTADVGTRRPLPHGYFATRLEEECARVSRQGGAFVVARLQVSGEGVGRAEHFLGQRVRRSDVLASFGPNDYEVLLLDAQGERAESVLDGLEEGLMALGCTVRRGVSAYPANGRSAEALMAYAADQVSGRAGEGVTPLVLIDDGMQRVHRLIERVAPSRISVLIIGETGVGKEVVAETVHRLSTRAEKPFLRLNCAALSESLLESELFGHEKGAFTGAHASKLGLLETAQGGTVFLDEIGELPAAMQVKLLRVIEDRKIMRVGGLDPIPIDVRFVAATNRDLDHEVARGRFRQDLFFRLNGVCLTIPPLRERPSEIEGLAKYFIDAAERAPGAKGGHRLSPQARALLLNYSWPGNIRELRNLIDRAVLLASDGVIRPEHFPLDRMANEPPPPPGPAGEPFQHPDPPPSRGTRVRVAPTVPVASKPVAEGRRSLAGDVEVIERQRIADALEQCHGNQTYAAKLLGISRGTLVSRLAAYGFPRPRKGGKKA